MTRDSWHLPHSDLIPYQVMYNATSVIVRAMQNTKVQEPRSTFTDSYGLSSDDLTHPVQSLLPIAPPSSFPVLSRVAVVDPWRAG